MRPPPLVPIIRSNMKIYRQGDVLIVSVDSVPTNLKPVPRTDRGVVLAEGEVTGHAHRIPSRHARLYHDETDVKFMKIGAGGATLLHEEHAPVEIPPGSYRVTIHHEYRPKELPRTVAD